MLEKVRKSENLKFYQIKKNAWNSKKILENPRKFKKLQNLLEFFVKSLEFSIKNYCFFLVVMIYSISYTAAVSGDLYTNYQYYQDKQSTFHHHFSRKT